MVQLMDVREYLNDDRNTLTWFMCMKCGRKSESVTGDIITMMCARATEIGLKDPFELTVDELGTIRIREGKHGQVN